MATPIPPPASCRDVQAQSGANDGADRQHTLTLGSPPQNVTVYCAGMTTATPREYLTLKRVESGFSVAGGAAASNMSVNAFSWGDGTQADARPVTTVYRKVRLFNIRSKFGFCTGHLDARMHCIAGLQRC